LFLLSKKKRITAYYLQILLYMNTTFFKPFFLFNATLLVSFCACSPKSNIESSSIPQQNITQNEGVSDAENEISSPPLLPAETDIWDVSDVDISEIAPDKKLISFTFDDSPSRSLENILSVFASFNEENPDCKASATLFCNGYLFDAQNAHLLTAACALGFELGNHTQSHKDLTTLDEEKLRREIDQTDILLSKIDGKPRHLLRAPFGKANDEVKACSPVPLIDWTIDTIDWTGVSEDAIYRAVFDNRFSGAIVLMHDGYQHTVDALKRLLPDLKADGYQVVSVSKMAKAHGCNLQKGKHYIRARKQNSSS